MGSDIVDFQRSKPFYPMQYDRDHSYMKDRAYWLYMIMFIGVMSYGAHKIEYERLRLQRWKRMDSLDSIPPHHLHNRGGVLIEKQFYGVEKYYRDSDAHD